MSAISLPTLFLGDAACDEFREAASWLIEHGAVIAADITIALAAVHDGFSPVILIVAQSWPGQFSNHQIDKLRRAAPLVRVISLAGSWTERESRSGTVVPGAMRAIWHQFAARYSRQDEGAAAWALPVTAAADERVSIHWRESIQAAESSAVAIGIYTKMRDSAETLIDLFAQRGWNANWISNADELRDLKIDCAVFDAHIANQSELAQLKSLRSALGEQPIIALIGFPRAEDIEQFTHAGATAVLAKPYLAEDLLWYLEQMLPQVAVQ